MSLRQRSAEASEGLELSAHNLVVDYRENGGVVRGLGGFTARFCRGVTGLIGPNGAGKTTFLRAAAGLLPPTRGRLEIRGKAPRSFLSAVGIGFLPENPSFPPFLTVEEFFLGITKEPPLVPTPGPLVGWPSYLGPLLNKRMATLSHGQRKKVALTAAILGDPQLLLLDEPTNGLDPLAVRELREILRAQKERGATLIVSSHHLDELQRVADVLVFVRDGSVVTSMSREEALETFGTLEHLFESALRMPGHPWEEPAWSGEGA